MARAFLFFDFGVNEETAQKARHRIEAWKQAFRLGNKVQCKLERLSSTSENSQKPHEDGSEGKPNAAKGKDAPDAGTTECIRVLIRLDFSAHEKHLYQTWLDRIPKEEPFKTAKTETIQRDAGNFEQISELFDSLH